MCDTSQLRAWFARREERKPPAIVVWLILHISCQQAFLVPRTSLHNKCRGFSVIHPHLMNLHDGAEQTQRNVNLQLLRAEPYQSWAGASKTSLRQESLALTQPSQRFSSKLLDGLQRSCVPIAASGGWCLQLFQSGFFLVRNTGSRHEAVNGGTRWLLPAPVAFCMPCAMERNGSAL